MTGPALLAVLGAVVGGDYAPASSDWNGLRTVAETAQRAGCPIEAREELDWAALDGTTVLWLVYPRVAVDPDRLARFLEAGGRALIGDDFGAADAALARLELTRRASSPGALRHFQDNPALPEADASADTPLGHAATAIVTNHPAWFATRWPATYRFLPGAAAVVEGRLGHGSFVALADPSVLINNMQEIPEDRLFAEALIAAQCRPHVDRIVLVSGRFAERGEPQAALPEAPPSPRPPAGAGPGGVNAALADVNGALARNDPPGPGPLAVSALGAVVLALLALGRSLPQGLPRYDGSWTRARSRPAGDPSPWRHALPASALRDEVVLRAAEALGEPASVLDADEIFARLDRRFGERAAVLGRTLWRELELPMPSRAREQRSSRSHTALGKLASRPRLEKLHAQARELFDLIGGHKESEISRRRI